MTTMTTMTKPKKSQVLPLLAAVGRAGYTGRKFSVVRQATYALNNGDLVWQGGSRTEVWFLRAVARAGGRTTFEVVDAAVALGCPVRDGAATLRGPIPADVVVVEYSVFCGVDCGFRFIAGTHGWLETAAAVKALLGGAPVDHATTAPGVQ